MVPTEKLSTRVRPRLLVRKQRGGFALLEVLFAAAVLAIAISGSAGAMLSAMQLDRVNREQVAAVQAARRVLEQAQDVDFAEVFAAYNSVAGDDPAAMVAAGTVPGASFECAGLNVQPGYADGFSGEIIFPTVMNGGVLELREDVVDPLLGMPADLNMDGVIDGLDHSGDYHVLPVRARVRWRGVTGNRTFDVVTMLSDRS